MTTRTINVTCVVASYTAKIDNANFGPDQRPISVLTHMKMAISVKRCQNRDANRNSWMKTTRIPSDRKQGKTALSFHTRNECVGPSRRESRHANVREHHNDLQQKPARTSCACHHNTTCDARLARSTSMKKTTVQTTDMLQDGCSTLVRDRLPTCKVLTEIKTKNCVDGLPAITIRSVWPTIVSGQVLDAPSRIVSLSVACVKPTNERVCDWGYRAKHHFHHLRLATWQPEHWLQPQNERV